MNYCLQKEFRTITMKIAICDDNELSAKLVHDTILQHPSYADASISIYTTSTDLENLSQKPKRS